MDITIKLLIYATVFIVILKYITSNKNIIADDNITEDVQYSLNDYLNDSIKNLGNEEYTDLINYKIQTIEKHENKRHAMLLEQIKRLNKTNSDILKNQFNTTKSSSGSTSVSEVEINQVGQTFRRLLTEHPYRFNKVSLSNFSTRIQISWNFNDILPKYDDLDIVATLNFFNVDTNDTRRNLPYIKYIKVQVYYSGTWYNIPSELLEPDTPSLTYNDTNGIILNGNIDSSEAKNLRILRAGVGLPGGPSGDLTQDVYDILDGTNNFVVRVYGINNAPENAPPVLNNSNITANDDRVLVYNTSFLVGSPATDPTLISGTVSSNSITITLQVSQTESGDDSSPAKISSLTVKYVEAESLGYNITLDTTEQTLTQTYDPVVAKNTNFSATISNLEYGMKYNTAYSTLNTLSAQSDYTDLSLIKDSPSGTALITPPPPTVDNPNISISFTNSKTTVISPNISATSVIYFNSRTSGSFNVSNTSLQTFEISNPVNSPTLVNGKFKGIGASFSEVSGSWVRIAQEIRRSDVSGVRTNEVLYYPTNPIVSNQPLSTTMSNTSKSDPYSGVSGENFRLRGQIQYNNIDISNIPTFTGQSVAIESDEVIYSISNIFARTTEISDYSPAGSYTEGSETIELKTEDNFVLDELTGNPTISNTDITVSTNEIIYTMGIPSVKSIDITPEDRSYTNVNSTNAFLASNLKIADFAFTGGDTSHFNGVNTTVVNYTLNNSSEIDRTGEYSSSTQFDISNAVVNSAETGPIISSTLNYRDRVYNLNGTVQNTGSKTFNIHCDRSSYDSNFNRNCPTNSLYQVDSIDLFDRLQIEPSNELTIYTDHTSAVLAHTMLFYKNTFNVDTGNYPIAGDFLTMNYSDSTNGLDLSLPTSSSAAESQSGTQAKYKTTAFAITPSEITTLINNNSLSETNGGSVYSFEIETYLTNKKVKSSIITECKTLYNSDSFCLIFSKFAGLGNTSAQWCVGHPYISFNTGSNAFWYKLYENSSGDTGLLKFYSDNTYNGCKHTTENKLSIVYKEGSAQLDLNESIYVVIGSKI